MYAESPYKLGSPCADCGGVADARCKDGLCSKYIHFLSAVNQEDLKQPYDHGAPVNCWYFYE